LDTGVVAKLTHTIVLVMVLVMVLVVVQVVVLVKERSRNYSDFIFGCFQELDVTDYIAMVDQQWT
jgi:hypothetical protein